MKRRKITAAIIIAAGALFIAAGLLRGEQNIVLMKAIRICLECIGIG